MALNIIESKVLSILLLVPLCINAFSISASNNLDCKPSKVQCLSNDTFTTCININGATYLVNQILKCPDGYFCDDNGNGPCTNSIQPTVSSTLAPPQEVSTTLAPLPPQGGSTTLAPLPPQGGSTTTRPTVARPTDLPTCNDSNIGSFHGAAACNQYYVCTKTYVFFIGTFSAKLTTCENDLVFSITFSSCVDPSLSDCP